MGKKILVVDDEGLVTKTLEKLLNKQGYCAVIATSGQAAIEKCKASDFDLIICDVRMPGLDGMETIEKLRQTQKEKGRKQTAPEIIITGYADQDKYKNALKLGVADYIFKPFDLRDFLETIKRNLDAAT